MKCIIVFEYIVENVILYYFIGILVYYFILIVCEICLVYNGIKLLFFFLMFNS